MRPSIVVRILAASTGAAVLVLAACSAEREAFEAAGPRPTPTSNAGVPRPTPTAATSPRPDIAVRAELPAPAGPTRVATTPTAATAPTAAPLTVGSSGPEVDAPPALPPAAAPEIAQDAPPEPGPDAPAAAGAAPLTVGSSGPEVEALQHRLVELGFIAAAQDHPGVFGAGSASAVLAFQKFEAIGRDGAAGPETMERLAAPQGRRAEPSSGIDVDLARQIMFVHHGGAVAILNTSTGNGETYWNPGTETTNVAYTPTGSFSVYLTVDGDDVGPLGTLYRPLYFHGGWAVHGSPSVPAYPASHGCARLANADTDWLWSIGAGPGTEVRVHESL
ncbi:MAG: L,D-transpeptidase family protein [Acidimicrobiia bacterium]|nr:L,D-transpeptidase family protein [Acidimicrobiia bacterium]